NFIWLNFIVSVNCLAKIYKLTDEADLPRTIIDNIHRASWMDLFLPLEMEPVLLLRGVFAGDLLQDSSSSSSTLSSSSSFCAISHHDKQLKRGGVSGSTRGLIHHFYFIISLPCLLLHLEDDFGRCSDLLLDLNRAQKSILTIMTIELFPMLPYGVGMSMNWKNADNWKERIEEHFKNLENLIVWEAFVTLCFAFISFDSNLEFGGKFGDGGACFDKKIAWLAIRPRACYESGKLGDWKLDESIEHHAEEQDNDPIIVAQGIIIVAQGIIIVAQGIIIVAQGIIIVAQGILDRDERHPYIDDVIISRDLIAMDDICIALHA
ncbi:hypothetical protein ACJX0J_022540, partial [Zea mays]